MVYLLYAIFFVSCLVLVASVLLQPGKTDAGALFTSNVSSSAFAPRGTATVLSKVTIVAATTFMLSALFLAMPALTGNISVLSSNPDTPADAPAANTDANSAVTNSNVDATGSAANSAADANSNGALIQTPATDEEKSKAANSAAINTAVAPNNTAPGTKPAANVAKTAPAKPVANK